MKNNNIHNLTPLDNDDLSNISGGVGGGHLLDTPPTPEEKEKLMNQQNQSAKEWSQINSQNMYELMTPIEL